MIFFFKKVTLLALDSPVLVNCTQISISQPCKHCE